ncbi:MAG: RagB/SusD family nutrient uptake outer membrane protein [Hymenobacter sp.]
MAAVFSNRNSAESLFEIQQNDQNNAGTSNDGLATYFAGYSPNGDQGVLYGRGDVRVLGGFANQYEDDDVRGTDSLSAITTKKLIYLSDGNNRVNWLRTLKWRVYGQNIPVIRLAEMYLTRAECEIRGGQLTAAAQDVNLIRARSGASQYATVTLANVLLERQLELAFRGLPHPRPAPHRRHRDSGSTRSARHTRRAGHRLRAPGARHRCALRAAHSAARNRQQLAADPERELLIEG